MKPEEKKLFEDSLSKLYKIEPETLASLYNEAGDLVNFSPILEADAARIATFKTDKDSQYKRGVKEGAQKIESPLKEKYEFESDLQGVDLVDAIILKKVEEATKSADKKDVTKHADYIRMVGDYEKKLKDKDKEWTTKLEEREREFSKAQIFEKVRTKALAQLENRKPILPADARKAQTWKETYLNDLRSYNYQEGNDGSIMVLDKTGEILKNAHGKPYTFDEFEKETAEKYFEYQKAEQRSSSGAQQQQQQQQQGNAQWPKNEDERLQLLRDPKITPARRKELTEYVIN